MADANGSESPRPDPSMKNPPEPGIATGLDANSGAGHNLLVFGFDNSKVIDVNQQHIAIK